MRSMLHALTWEYIHKVSWLLPMTFGGSFVFLLVYASIASVTPEGLSDGDPVQMLLEIALLPVVIFITVFGLGSGIWPVSRFYTKPISNLSITTWIIGSGLVLLLLQLPLIVWCYNYYFKAGWPMWGALLFTATLWVVAQPFFLVGTKSFTRAVLTGVPLALMLAWYMSRYGLLGGQRHDWDRVTVGEMAFLGLTSAAFGYFTFYAVAADRCGESARPTALRQAILSWLHSWTASRATLRPAFRSAWMAQFWYQWRYRGWGLLWTTVLVITIIVLVFSYNMMVGRAGWWDLAAALSGIPDFISFICLLYGFVLGFDLDRLVNSSTRRQHAGALGDADTMGSFLATRPLSDATIARVNLLVCAGTLTLALAVWLLVYLAAIGLAVINAGWTDMGYHQLRWESQWLMACVAWILASNSMTLVCTGRLKQWFIALGTLLLVFIITLIALSWLSSRQIADAFLMACGALFALAVLVITVVCFAAAYQRRMLTPGGLAFILVATAALVGFTVWISPAPAEQSAWVVVGAMALLAVLPLASMPLAIAANRHG